MNQSINYSNLYTLHHQRSAFALNNWTFAHFYFDTLKLYYTILYYMCVWSVRAYFNKIRSLLTYLSSFVDISCCHIVILFAFTVIFHHSFDVNSDWTERQYILYIWKLFLAIDIEHWLICSLTKYIDKLNCQYSKEKKNIIPWKNNGSN